MRRKRNGEAEDAILKLEIDDDELTVFVQGNTSS